MTEDRVLDIHNHFTYGSITNNEDYHQNDEEHELISNSATDISESEAPPLPPPPRRSSTPDDPLNLNRGKISEFELGQLRKTSKGLHKFYTEQNELIEEILAPVDAEEDEEATSKHNLKVKIAIYGSVTVNVILLGLQLVAAIRSGSLSIFATCCDAFMDLLSSVILLVSSRLASKPEIYKYPSGNSRFETVGIVVYGSLMATVSLELIIHAVTRLLGPPEAPDLDILSIALVGTAFGSKLILYIYCKAIADPSSQVLALDHRNDLIVNSLGLGLAIAGHRIYPLLDPVGGILVALVILCSWTSTVLEHCTLVVGICADPNFIKRLIYIAMTHDDKILQVDTCRAYHAGTKVVVEVDIVMPPETPLRVTHDVGESLQVKLESLQNVDRAFVHCDYESTHRPEHQKYM